MGITKTIVGTGTLGLLVYWAIRYFSRPSEKPRFKPGSSYYLDYYDDYSYKNYRNQYYDYEENQESDEFQYQSNRSVNTSTIHKNLKSDESCNRYGKKISSKSLEYQSIGTSTKQKIRKSIESHNQYDKQKISKTSEYESNRSLSSSTSTQQKLLKSIEPCCHYDKKIIPEAIPTGSTTQKNQKSVESKKIVPKLPDNQVISKSSEYQSSESVGNSKKRKNRKRKNKKKSNVASKCKLSSKLNVPSNWSKNNYDFEEDLTSSDEEYHEVKSMLKGIPLNNLISISRIQNSYLYHRYLLRKLEYETLGIRFVEQDLFHATGESNIPSIIEDNLDWRPVKRSRFGRGVSFSTDCEYANKYCNGKIGSERAMIIAKVLVGNTCKGGYSMKIPPKEFDTSKRNNMKVLVKYYDDEFYPQYVAYYDDN